MNELRIRESWEQVKGKLKDEYPILTDKDLVYEEGREEQLLAHLQEKLGKSKREVKTLLRELSS